MAKPHRLLGELKLMCSRNRPRPSTTVTSLIAQVAGSSQVVDCTWCWAMARCMVGEIRCESKSGATGLWGNQSSLQCIALQQWIMLNASRQIFIVPLQGATSKGQPSSVADPDGYEHDARWVSTPCIPVGVAGVSRTEWSATTASRPSQAPSRSV